MVRETPWLSVTRWNVVKLGKREQHMESTSPSLNWSDEHYENFGRLRMIRAGSDSTSRPRSPSELRKVIASGWPPLRLRDARSTALVGPLGTYRITRRFGLATGLRTSLAHVRRVVAER